MIRSILVALQRSPQYATAGNAQVATLPEPERPALKSEAIITGDIVRIGDLIENAGIVCVRADFPRARSWLHRHHLGRHRA